MVGYPYNVVEFDLGYLDKKIGKYFVRGVYNITLMDKDGQLRYEVEKLVGDYQRLEVGSKLNITWGSSHRKSKVDFTEPSPEEITKELILFLVFFVSLKKNEAETIFFVFFLCDLF